jgi:RNA ligase (TIGR02306 family)
MADWKVSLEEIQVFPHPNADKLELGKLGGFQVVIPKGQYKNDDKVAFIPAGSLLPDYIADIFRDYLVGPLKNRVKTITLRGELSEGIIVDVSILDENIKSFDIGQDISEFLNITKYEPPIPIHMAGDVHPINRVKIMTIDQHPIETEYKIRQHDVENFGIYADEFIKDERVIVTEKIHGSQISIIKLNGEITVTSKGLLNRGLGLKQSDSNLYWRALKNTNLIEIIKEIYSQHNVQVFGEVIPCQKGFNYGASQPTILIYKVIVEGYTLPLPSISGDIFGMWVPVLYDGPYDIDIIRPLATAKEQLSGDELHIKEGIVIQPFEERYDSTNKFSLLLKILNPAYKMQTTGEEFN